MGKPPPQNLNPPVPPFVDLLPSRKPRLFFQERQGLHILPRFSRNAGMNLFQGDSVGILY